MCIGYPVAGSFYVAPIGTVREALFCVLAGIAAKCRADSKLLLIDNEAQPSLWLLPLLAGTTVFVAADTNIYVMW